jgi:predicted glycoside hydrolase/deacetylase ChbG (UPF0249 family)
MDKRIIINADDFGLCDGVNKAVAQAHTKGVLTSATIMTNMPAAKEAAKMAKKMPKLGVGVHLNLLEGRPVSKDNCIECLVDGNGRFAFSPLVLSLLSIGRHKIRNAIRKELTAQIQWVIDNGLAPTHLDSHKHIHSFPALFPIVCELARRFEIAAVRFTLEPKGLSQMPWPLPKEGGRERAARLRTMAKINRIQNPHFLKTNAFLGVAHMGRIDVNFFKAVTLYNSAPTAEVMTHPGLAGAGSDKTGSLHQRKVELEALCSKRTKQYFQDARIKLVHYGKL